jgi:hypothetical protein
MGVCFEHNESSRCFGGAHSAIRFRAAEPRRRFAHHDVQGRHDVNGHGSRCMQRAWGQGQGGRHGGACNPRGTGRRCRARSLGGRNALQGRDDFRGHRPRCVQRPRRAGEACKNSSGRGRKGRPCGARVHGGCARCDATPGWCGICFFSTSHHGRQVDPGRRFRALPVGQQHGSNRSHGEVQGRNLFEVATPRGILLASWRGGRVVDRCAVGIR